ncbi:hypothetical protein GCM10009825_12720 [Arthrobacter humicola]|uniref:Uncharacterized protein n=1 Tax=Arthrobacter humicola TaxID=409291 RepID=A0ABN2YT74_9MICC
MRIRALVDAFDEVRIDREARSVEACDDDHGPILLCEGKGVLLRTVGSPCPFVRRPGQAPALTGGRGDRIYRECL